MTWNELAEIVERHAAKLGEHFDNVQIHVSCPGSAATPQEEGTFRLHRGVGDWYARQGLAHEFIEEDKADEVGRSVARSLPKEEQ